MGSDLGVASVLRDLRRRQGETLRSAAAELGIAPSHLSRLERGERSINDDTLRRLSKHYSVDAEIIELARGNAPADVIQILRDHPDELRLLREKYAK
ncbi:MULTISPECIES: helix-turn-helix domain-containing protein [Microbacterium]|jgi:transcriptional regulator with XRE-family HTH domain|uniref:helix-turn-helix domain-containing protein n=1 Tax=Microbacterium TaxID=33882 RepID=UPI0035ABACEE|nr:helix-turn-helix domain-containing protein [Microbacterium testaceum]